MRNKGASVTPEQLIITTGSQQALDLIGKTMISPGDKVIVEALTFLATIQCFKLYGAELITAPIDADGVQADKLEQLIDQHKPKFVYLIPTFGNPSGAVLARTPQAHPRSRRPHQDVDRRGRPLRRALLPGARRRPACWRSAMVSPAHATGLPTAA